MRTAVEVGLEDVGEIVELGLTGSAWDGVTVRVITESDGSIVTAVPIEGPGVIRNPKGG